MKWFFLWFLTIQAPNGDLITRNYQTDVVSNTYTECLVMQDKFEATIRGHLKVEYKGAKLISAGSKCENRQVEVLEGDKDRDVQPKKEDLSAQSN